VPELIKNGSIQHPKLGIEWKDVESLGPQDALPVSYGVLIVGIQRGGPAANAGLRGLSRTEDGIVLGDIIVGVDGEKISNNEEMLRALDRHKMGETVKVEVVRKGSRSVVPVQLTELPAANRRRGYGE
jgi:S1-C subfamily serine protease